MSTLFWLRQLVLSCNLVSIDNQSSEMASSISLILLRRKSTWFAWLQTDGVFQIRMYGKHRRHYVYAAYWWASRHRRDRLYRALFVEWYVCRDFPCTLLVPSATLESFSSSTKNAYHNGSVHHSGGIIVFVSLQKFSGTIFHEPGGSFEIVRSDGAVCVDLGMCTK